MYDVSSQHIHFNSDVMIKMRSIQSSIINNKICHKYDKNLKNMYGNMTQNVLF